MCAISACNMYVQYGLNHIIIQPFSRGDRSLLSKEAHGMVFKSWDVVQAISKCFKHYSSTSRVSNEVVFKQHVFFERHINNIIKINIEKIK
jgi:type I site-specific restriction-modification system R (restriction) subunit